MASAPNIPSPQLVYNGFVPCNGPKSIPIPLDFSAGGPIFELDITNMNQQGDFEAIQTIYLDNSANPFPVTITCRNTNQNITIPPFSQAYMPLLQPNPPDIQITSLGTAKVFVQLLNFYLPPLIWGTANIPPVNWSLFHDPAATTQATVTRPAVVGVQHVAETISYTVGAVAAQTVLQIVLRDGASGAGAIIWGLTVGPIPAGSSVSFSQGGLNIPGTRGNAMTLEFTAAPVATNFESVALVGLDQ
jgi:hypothetical protein